MGNVLDKIVEKMKTHFLYPTTFFPPENLAVYETMSKNLLETMRPQMTSKYGAYALRAGVARPHSLKRMHTRPGTHMHARTRTHAQ
jgi:hypothetical protein